MAHQAIAHGAIEVALRSLISHTGYASDAWPTLLAITG
jgi:hypothetical protein